MKEDNLCQLGDYDAPFCEQQYTHGSCYISLFKLKSFDQFNPPKLHKSLDIHSVVALYMLRSCNLREAIKAAARPRILRMKIR